MSLKVVAVCDKEGSAIWRLAQGTRKYNDNLDYQVLAVHPKKPNAEQLAAFENQAKDADVIDFGYYKTAGMLLQRYPWLADKKKILQIHNPYCITESDWNDYDAVVANNQTIYKRLGEITKSPTELIPNTIDLDFWQFNQDWQPNNHVIMVAARIESKKGILPVAQACAEVGLMLDLVGSVSNAQYLYDVMQTGAVTFHENITDEALRDLYYNSTICVCNSVDNFESGPNPILEAMATGVPVLTRNVGHVPDLNNGTNMVINESQSEDVAAITALLTDMINDKKQFQSLRDAAWQTAKTRSNDRRAFQYQMLYRKVLYPNSKTVSIIVPVCGKADITRRNLDAVARQTYKNIELIVVDDGLGKDNEEAVRSFAAFVDFPVRYIRTARLFIDSGTDETYKEYGLARARNKGVVASTGEVLVFCDQRQIMEPECVEEFLLNVKHRTWLFGDKGAQKSEFVENLSCIYRKDLIFAGLFNEMCDKYGGLSEETRKRIRAQGLRTEYIAEAKATATGKSSNRNRKRDEVIASKNMLWKLYGAFE